MCPVDRCRRPWWLLLLSTVMEMCELLNVSAIPVVYTRLTSYISAPHVMYEQQSACYSSLMPPVEKQVDCKLLMKQLTSIGASHSRH